MISMKSIRSNRSHKNRKSHKKSEMHDTSPVRNYYNSLEDDKKRHTLRIPTEKSVKNI